MTTIQNKADNIKILLDLKPALDGYAGIPQETRLLFRGLRSMDSCEVEGLIQHGSRKLRSALATKGKRMPVSKRINRISRVIVSLSEKPSRFNTVLNTISRTLLRPQVSTGWPIHPSVFESELFDDFIWQTFFSKTLTPSDKKLVTSARYRVLNISRKMLHQVGLAGIKYPLIPKYITLDTRGFDFFLAQTPFPARISRGTKMIVRYHDAVPVLLPHTINDKSFHQSSHFYSLQQNVKSGAWFSCVSEATRNDLLKIFPEAESRSSVIHNIVSGEYFEDDAPKGLVFQIVRNRLGRVKEFQTDLGGIRFDDNRNQSQDFNYLLMVSTLEPRKNHMLLLSAWERLKYTSMPKLKLVIVGSKGWDSTPILEAFKPWAERGDLFYLNNVPSTELRVLYKHAAATICPSVAEGFDYSGVEAMRCGGIVISSDIPVHREVFRNASEYFSPYSTEDAAMVIRRVLSEDGESIRKRLRAEARQVSDSYMPHNILPKWNEFFQMQKKSRGTSRMSFFNRNKKS